MNIKIKIVDKLNEKLDVNELSRIYIFFNRILDVYNEIVDDIMSIDSINSNISINAVYISLYKPKKTKI